MTVTTNKSSYVNREQVTVTTLVKDALGNPVSSASVSSVMTTANAPSLPKPVPRARAVLTFTRIGQHPQAWHRYLFGDIFSNKVGIHCRLGYGDVLSAVVSET